jgi:beta-lactam-binding protein with PASTA domain
MPKKRKPRLPFAAEHREKTPPGGERTPLGLENGEPLSEPETPAPEKGGDDAFVAMEAVNPPMPPDERPVEDAPPIEASHSTGGEEVSIFDSTAEDNAPRSTPTPKRVESVPGAATAQVRKVPPPQAGGDTIRMKAVATPPQQARQSRAQRRQGRIADLPRRSYASRSRFGFFSFIFGFVGLVFKMIFVTVLVMALAAWFSYEAVRMYVKTPEVTVPNVRGMREADAVKLLSAKKLALIEERSEPSPLVAPGEIIDQRPLPGTSAKEHTLVRIVISSGRSNFIVPDVVGETRDNALNKIKGAGLEVGDVLTIENEKVPKDAVISQNPEANKGLDQPAKVDLLISAGPRGSSLTMPDVTGRSVPEARATLNALGITSIATDPPNSQAGIVTSQAPLVGKLILQSQTVTLRVGPSITP